MSLEPGRVAVIPASRREPRGRWRPGPGRHHAIPVVPEGGAIPADQIPGGVIPAGAAATPAREVRAVTDGIRDPPPPGAAATQDPTHRPAGCLPSPGRPGPPGRRGFRGIVPPGQHSRGASATAGPAARTYRAIPVGRGILLSRGARGGSDGGARCRAASGSASSSPARPAAPPPPWWPGARLVSCSDSSWWPARWPPRWPSGPGPAG